MKIYKTQKEIEADIVDGILTVKGDVKFEVSFAIEAKIVIKAGDIEAGNIKAGDIEAGNIKAWDIKAWNIEAGNIKAWDIEAWDIKAWDIEAGNISFWGVAFAYISFKCKSIVGRRENHKYFCLDKDVEVTGKQHGL
jgi:hypothetical protein